MEDAGIFYGFLVNFPAFGHILLLFGISPPPFWYILPILVCCTKKNLATLAERIMET
jgi:hypothetical protein